MKPTSARRAAHTPEEMHNDDVAHEHSDINVRRSSGPRSSWSAVVVVTAGLMFGLFEVLEARPRRSDPKLSPLALPATTMPPTTNASPFFGSAPEPQLLTNEPAHLKDVRERRAAAAAQLRLGGREGRASRASRSTRRRS